MFVLYNDVQIGLFNPQKCRITDNIEIIKQS